MLRLREIGQIEFCVLFEYNVPTVTWQHKSVFILSELQSISTTIKVGKTTEAIYILV